MSPLLIFQVLFLIAACVGAFGVVTSKPWGTALGLFGLILFDLTLLIAGK